MHIGVCHAITLPGTWEEAISQAGALGFEGVEIFVRQENFAELLDNPSRARDLRQQAEKAGVVIASICLSVLGREPRVYDADPSLRAEALRRARNGIARCAELGGSVVLLPGAPSLDDQEAVGRWVEALRELAADGARHQVRVAIETGLTGGETVQILDVVGSPWVGDYFDMGNVAARGMDPAEEVRLRGRHVAQVHCKGVRGAPLGEGTVDLEAVAQALRDIGYQGWVMLETARGDRPLEAIAAEREQMLRVMRDA